MLTPILRTIVPALWGSAIGWLLSIVPALEPLREELLAYADWLTPVIAALIIGAWYTLWSKLQGFLPDWVVAILLGSPRTPTYQPRHSATGDSALTDWHEAPDRRGTLGVAAVLAVVLLVLASVPASAASVTYPYTAHVQSVGWQGMVGDGATAGTTGKALQLEAIRFVFPGQQARGHVQDVGWQAWQANDSTQVGTVGKSKRLEAIQVRSTIPGVTIECQAHVQGIGWMPRVRDGQVCGTTGKGLRLEAVRLWLVDNN